MTSFYDALETRTPAEREAAHMAALPVQVAHARAHSPAFAAILADVDPALVTSRAALARLPVTRKHELLERQQAERSHNVFGGFATVGFGAAMPRVFASPGPIYEPEGTRRDYWRMARALNAAGFKAGELIHNCFSYHFVPAGSMMESGAHALGCTVFPGGTGQTEQQVQAMADLRPAGYIGTPSFLKLIVEKALDMQVPLPSITTLSRALNYANTFGYAVWLRPQDKDLGKGVAASGALATRMGLAGVPVAAETIALHTIFELIRGSQTRIHLCISPAPPVWSWCAAPRPKV